MSSIPNREAFRVARLSELVSEAKALVERTRVSFAAARGQTKAVARRELKRAQIILNRAEQGLKAELQGEVAGPAVQRHGISERKPIVNEQGGREMGEVILREPRIVTHGKSVTLVTALDHLRNRSSITDDQHAAGKRYRAAYELAGLDAYPVGMGEGIGGTPCSGNRRIEEALGSSWELQRMRTVLVNGYCIGLIEHVAVHDGDVSSWAERHGKDRKGVMGQVQLLLGMLAARS